MPETFKNSQNKNLSSFALAALEAYASLYMRVRESTGHKVRFLLILGHHRSGSTLLAHILSSNKDVLGYGETQLSYHSTRDLDRLVADQFRFWKQLYLRRRYVLDKIVNDLVVDESLFSNPDVYVLFLLREPIKTISSLIVASGCSVTQDDATTFYTRRLGALETFARQLNGRDRAFFLTHDQLINQTTQALGELQGWLGLSEPLTEQYKTTKVTGVWGPGDGSPNIKAGRIVRDYETIELLNFDPRLKLLADDAYERCHLSLSQACLTLSQPVICSKTPDR